MQARRIIALLDVLGFSSLVGDQDFDGIFSDYVKTIRNAILRTDQTVDYVVFSDSIVLISNGCEEKDLLAVAEITSTLSFDIMINQGLAIRGCISHGPVTYSNNDRDVVVAGVPIVEAYRYEQLQNWIGVIISPKTVSSFPSLTQLSNIGNINNPANVEKIKLNFPWMTCIQRWGGVPFKGQGNFDGYVLVPHDISSCDSDHLNNDLTKYIEKLDQLQSFAPSVDVQEKYKNSKQFLVEVNKRWEQVWQSETCRNILWTKSVIELPDGSKSITISHPARREVPTVL